MRKIVIALALAASLGACSNIQNAFNLATAPVTVTPAMQYDAENGLKIAVSGLVAYRRLCLQKAIDPVTRKCRGVIARIQPYTRAAKTALLDMRAALKENNQQNAISAYGALQQLVINIQAERAAAGVQ